MTFNHGVLLAIGALLVSSTATRADDVYDRCIDASDGTNTAWSACGGELLAREDARLNVTWKRVFAVTSGQTRADLLTEQRAWIAFKDTSCAFYRNGDWGREGQVLHFPVCRAKVIADRTTVLESYEASFQGR